MSLEKFLKATIFEQKTEIIKIAILSDYLKVVDKIAILFSYFDRKYEIDKFDDVSDLLVYKQYNYVFVNNIDNFDFYFYINPRILKFGSIYTNSDLSKFDDNYTLLYDNLYQKKYSQNLINYNVFYDKDSKNFLRNDEEFQAILLEDKKLRNDEKVDFVVSKSSFSLDTKNFYKLKKQDISVSIICCGLGESYVFLLILKQVFNLLNQVSLYIDIRFFKIIELTFKEEIEEGRLFLHTKESYSPFVTKEFETKRIDIMSNFLYNFLIQTEDIAEKISKYNFYNELDYKVNIADNIMVHNLYKKLKNDKIKRIAGLSYGTLTERSSLNKADLEEFITKHSDTLFILHQYKAEDFEDIEKWTSLNNLIFIYGIDTNSDFYRAKIMFQYYDYFITIDNTSLYQFATSSKPVYYLKFLNEDTLSNDSLQIFDIENKWLFFNNVRKYEDIDYKVALANMLDDIEREQYLI